MSDNTRGTWSNQLEFVLTLVGFAVGLGNVWRFPYLCYKNGGGAFLIPYFTCLVVIGIPLFYLEICIGQYASLGPLKVWRVNPALKGLGYAMVIVSGLIGLYYCVIIGWCLRFLFASMTAVLPWISCSNAWNTCMCREKNLNSSNLIDPWNGTRKECVNYTYINTTITTPTEDYWNHNVLEITNSLEDTGGIKWDLALCLLLAWSITFLVLCKGVKSLGKVVYFTAIFPYVLLTVLLVRGLTLDGYMEGITYYLTPNFEKLMNADVWADAAGQIFFSLSACQGGLLAMASYNKFNNNVLRDTFIIPVINCLTSFYGGFAIFSVLGFMAKSKGVSVDKVAVAGPGLAFVVYPEGMAQMPIAPLWSILFFFMMATLGFSSIFAITETIITGFIDEMTSILTTKWRVIGFRFCVCATGFLLGLPMVTRGGSYMLDIVDTNVGGFPLLFTGLFEIIAIIYIYGFIRFKNDIEMMIGSRLHVKVSFVYFGVTWCVLSPLALLGVIISKSIQYKPIEEISTLGEVLGWLIVIFPLVFIPFWFIYYTCRKGVGKLCLKLNSPADNWMPGNVQYTKGILDSILCLGTTEYKEPVIDDSTVSGCRIIAYDNRAYSAEYVRKEMNANNTSTNEQLTKFSYDNRAYSAEYVGKQMNANDTLPNEQLTKF